MKRVIKLLIFISLFSCEPIFNESESIKTVKNTFPNAKIYKIQPYRYIVIDNNCKIKYVECYNATNDNISGVYFPIEIK